MVNLVSAWGSDRWKLHQAGSEIGRAAVSGWRIPETPGFTVTRVRPKVRWTTGISPNHKVHLIERVFAVWAPDGKPFAAVRTVCRQAHIRYHLHAEPVEGKKICDRCTTSALGRYVVYRFFNVNQRLLYVGFTSDLAMRLRAHARDGQSPWWPDVAASRYQFFENADEALTCERQAIRDEYPVHNIRHATSAVTRG